MSKRCNNCGKEIPDDSIFCQFCGQKIIEIKEENNDSLSLDEEFGKVCLKLAENGKTDEVMQLLENLANKGYGEASLVLGQLYSKDTDKAEFYYQKAADAGIADAIWELSKRMNHNSTIDINNKQDIEWFRKVLLAAEKGNPNAMHEAGVIYRSLNKFSMSMYWYELASLYEHDDAEDAIKLIPDLWRKANYPDSDGLEGDSEKNEIGKLFLNIHSNLDVQNSFKKLINYANSGNGAAALFVARSYEDEGNIKEAFDLFRNGSFAKDMMATRCFGDLCFQKNQTQIAFTLYEEAAYQGEAVCMFIMGQKCENEGNTLLAASWYGRSISRGYSQSNAKLVGLVESAKAKSEGTKSSYQTQKDLSSNAQQIIHDLGFTSYPHFAMLDDGGMFEGLAFSRLNDPTVQSYAKINPELFLNILGAHMFGAGVFVAYYEKKLGKNAYQFNMNEALEMKKQLDNTDFYELGLKTLKIDATSEEKMKIDFVIFKIRDVAKEFYPSLINDNNSLMEYMKVLYYAGATVFQNR